MNKEKKVYKKPIVQKYGKIEDFTLGGGGDFNDGAEPASTF